MTVCKTVRDAFDSHRRLRPRCGSHTSGFYPPDSACNSLRGLWACEGPLQVHALGRKNEASWHATERLLVVEVVVHAPAGGPGADSTKVGCSCSIQLRGTAGQPEMAARSHKPSQLDATSRPATTSPVSQGGYAVPYAADHGSIPCAGTRDSPSSDGHAFTLRCRRVRSSHPGPQPRGTSEQVNTLP